MVCYHVLAADDGKSAVTQTVQALVEDFRQNAVNLRVVADEADRDDDLTTAAVYNSMARVWQVAADLLERRLNEIKE